jgi:hypothetical protein
VQGLPAINVTIYSRELLPHVFTLIPQNAGQLFSVALSVLTWGETRLFIGALLCAVRTFLPPLARRTIARLVASAKISRIFDFDFLILD